ncbi:PKD domain-containing protein [Chryseobacterium gambrini]|uniref:PKD domain-containing protein n=1 Tax=Chryseobacterium gambrini TaxID=373672 RepID=A0A1N7QB38_9FLAO|nr:hypothetical protein [Chryseobacterium gambrini]SIT20108.1 hypothetical protein SAMN05421785_11064 [Chryseobacterium gambrini]
MNNQLNNIPEKYRNFIQLSDISTRYRKFSKGQYIEYTQFNEFLDFFEDQDRLSRVMLQGVGIVCGFKPELTYSNKKLNSIKLSQGVAVTTDGDLLTLNNTSKVSEELYVSDLKTISIDSKEYTHFKKYNNFKVNYPAFYDENGGQIELWELATAQEATSDFQQVVNFTDLEDQYLMLYLESYEKEVKPCRGVDCDNHGIQQIRNLKVLVTNEQGVNYILQKDRIQPHPLFIEDILGSVKQERVILERLIQEKGIETRFSYADLKNMYADVLERNGYGELVFRKIYEISKMFGLPVADHLTFKSVLEECLNLPFGFQYAYDVVKDLTATYSEIIRLLPKTFTKCLPDFASFPKHMMLGKLNSETQLDSSRHQFYNSPVLDDEKAMQRVKTLISRFNLQVQNFKYPNRNVEVIGNDIPIEAESAIKITPSQKSEFLGNKAIPFYYRITDNFLKVWDFNKVRTPAFRNNVGYNSGLFSQESYVRKPLGFNIDRASFYNIEGHQGMHFQDAFDQIKKIRDEQQLGFDIMLLSFKELLKNKDLSKAYFNEYIDKYSGLEHKHGVEKGGTFIMVYDNMGRDEIVVADFSIPYICCTPKVKINLSLPNTTICAKAEKIPFTVFPFNGIVTANVDSDLDGGVELVDGLYFFNPASVSQELHNQLISFNVNGKPTDCTVTVITEPQVRIVVEKVDLPESDSTSTVVKFKITGDHFMDYQYSWDFLDNGSQVIQNPDSEGFVTHTFNNLSPRIIPTIRVKVNGGGCEQNIVIEKWYNNVPSNISVNAGADQTFVQSNLGYGTPVLRKIKNIGSPPNYGAHANPNDKFLIELGIEDGAGTDINTCRLYYKKQSSSQWYSDGSSVYNGTQTEILFNNIVNQGEILDFKLGVYISGSTTEIFSNQLSLSYYEINNATEGEIRFPDEWIAQNSVQSVLTPFTINLNGSVQLSGSTLNSVSWEVISGPAGAAFSFGNSTNVVTTFSTNTFGTYILRLSASNSSAQSSSDEVTIIINRQMNASPVAVATWNDGTDGVLTVEWDTYDPYSATWYGFYQAQLSGSASSDSDGHIVGYYWQYNLNGSGWNDFETASPTFPNIPTPTKSIETNGNWKFRFKVKDDFGTISNWSNELILNITDTKTGIPSNLFALNILYGGLGYYNTQAQLNNSSANKIHKLVVKTISYTNTVGNIATDKFLLRIEGNGTLQYSTPAVGVERDITSVMNDNMLITIDLDYPIPAKNAIIKFIAYDINNNIMDTKTIKMGNTGNAIAYVSNGNSMSFPIKVNSNKKVKVIVNGSVNMNPGWNVSLANGLNPASETHNLVSNEAKTFNLVLIPGNTYYLMSNSIQGPTGTSATVELIDS